MPDGAFEMQRHAGYCGIAAREGAEWRERRRAIRVRVADGALLLLAKAVDENIDVTAALLPDARKHRRLHTDRRPRLDLRRRAAIDVRRLVASQAPPTRRGWRRTRRKSTASHAVLRLTRRGATNYRDQRLPPGIDCWAMRAKSPMTFCIEENAGPPDAITPCIAATRFCACFMSGIIAMTALASFAPGTPAI